MCSILTLLLASSVLLPLLPPLFPHLILKYYSMIRLFISGHIIFGKRGCKLSILIYLEYRFVRTFWKSELYPECFIHKAALVMYFSHVGY